MVCFSPCGCQFSITSTSPYTYLIYCMSFFLRAYIVCSPFSTITLQHRWNCESNKGFSVEIEKGMQSDQLSVSRIFSYWNKALATSVAWLAVQSLARVFFRICIFPLRSLLYLCTFNHPWWRYPGLNSATGQTPNTRDSKNPAIPINRLIH